MNGSLVSSKTIGVNGKARTILGKNDKMAMQKAEAANERCRAMLGAKTGAKFAILKKQNIALIGRLDTLQKENDRLKRVITIYGGHASECDIVPCLCGFTDCLLHGKEPE